MRTSLLAIPIALAIWALAATIGISLKRAASRGELPVLHLGEVDE